MPATHALAAPESGVYRVARSVEAFAFHVPEALPRPAPEPIEDGNRWDDAEGRFATVYCASSAEAAFGEMIARYRKRPGLLGRIDSFLTQRPDAEYDPMLTPGVLPAEFFDRRWLGHVGVDLAVRFVDVEDSATHAAIDPTLCRQLRGYGIRRVDRSTFLSPDRRVTRTIATRYHWLAQTPDHASWRGTAVHEPARARMGVLGDLAASPAARERSHDREGHPRAPRGAQRRRPPLHPGRAAERRHWQLHCCFVDERSSG